MVYGGQTDSEHLRIAPTVMDHVTWEDAVMGEEIFGPVLPVLTYQSLEEAARKINGMDSPWLSICFPRTRITYAL